ncbi:MAG TPA: TolC family protein [Longimicrobiales bacterium]
MNALRMRRLAAAALLAPLAPAGLSAQETPPPVPERTEAQAAAAGTPLSLQDALSRALEQSEEVRLAAARVDEVRAQAKSARSAALPQVNAQLAYTRTLRSVFQNVGGFTLPDSLRFEPDPNQPLEERVRYLEDRTPNAALGALGALFSDLPFGNENTWIAGLSVSQPVFTGGRISSAISAAESAAEAARAGLEETRADVALEVKRAYYDALLASRSAEIVELSAELAREHLEQVRLRLEAGRASELEALRAEVELENLMPQLVQARNQRDVAMLNLKRLINLPADADIVLTTELDAQTSNGTDLVAIELPTPEQAEELLRRRAAVRAAQEQVAMREEQVDIARAAYLPTIALTGNLTRQAFPDGTFGFPGGDDWRDDWSVGFAVQLPLFQGFKRGADVAAAKAQVRQAELQLSQLREGLILEYRQARSELERAQAQVAAASRTVEQAERVYELTELRYREGLATQLDVSDARLALQQARINQVQAYHAAYTALAQAERTLGLPLDRTTLP